MEHLDSPGARLGTELKAFCFPPLGCPWSCQSPGCPCAQQDRHRLKCTGTDNWGGSCMPQLCFIKFCISPSLVRARAYLHVPPSNLVSILGSQSVALACRGQHLEFSECLPSWGKTLFRARQQCQSADSGTRVSFWSRGAPYMGSLSLLFLVP